MTFRLRHRLSACLWLVPLLCALAGVALSFATIAIDRATDYELVPQVLTGSASGAQGILSTIATSMVTLLTIVLTVTTVAIQLAMGQFSPRIVAALLRDIASQLAMGLFAATFAFALLAQRAVDVPPSGDAGSVPGLTMLVAFILVLASLATLILYVHHAGQSLRAAGLIDLVGDNSRLEIDRRFPGPPAQPGDPGIVAAPEPGVITQVNEAGLVAAARDAGCVLELVPAMGDFVPGGAPLLRVQGDASRLDHDRVARLVLVGPERTHGDDPAYGLRKLVDIAERALAEPFNDPSTAVQAIDRLHDCLRQLAPREFPSGEHRDAEGRVRFVHRMLEWDGWVRLAFDEIRIAGAGSPQIPRRLRAALEDLKTVAPPERQAPLDQQLALLDRAVERAAEDQQDAAVARFADQQGIGSGRDVMPPSARDGTNTRSPA